ncbi:MAG TPA: hypothetical protein DEA96_08920 [Leptospiraceae bacterium]|nr:hypothetical protein [Spirochaetaceae bacterium]HBS05073.1 hypothetical protein [Leptospiraceae bacterium]|tara:strand:+ start:74195 stop:74431 length:237 start_codon:yes stop_codon:yes gene_type:complete
MRGVDAVGSISFLIEQADSIREAVVPPGNGADWQWGCILECMEGRAHGLYERSVVFRKFVGLNRLSQKGFSASGFAST